VKRGSVREEKKVRVKKGEKEEVCEKKKRKKEREREKKYE
jgi:hypothetical protein